MKHIKIAEENDFVYDKRKSNFSKRDATNQIPPPSARPELTGPGSGSPHDIAIRAFLLSLFREITDRAKELDAPPDLTWPADKAEFIACHTQDKSEAEFYRDMVPKLRRKESR